MARWGGKKQTTNKTGFGVISKPVHWELGVGSCWVGSRLVGRRHRQGAGGTVKGWER